MNDNSNGRRTERPDMPAGTRTATVSFLARQIDHERIARRAYELYELRHRVEGHADEDWAQASSEYAARELSPVERYGASNSFGDRIRRARL